jgi:hypothetical protein
MRKLLALLLGATCVVGLIGCSGTDDLIGQSNPRIRVFNAMRVNDTLSATANGQTLATGLARGNASTETELSAGNYQLSVTRTSTGAEIVNHTDLLETNTNYLLIVGNDQATPDGFSGRLVRENEDITSGMAEVTWDRATRVFGDVDIYMIPDGGDLSVATKVVMDQIGEDNQVFVMNPGLYHIKVFAKGTTTTPLFTQDAVFSASHNYMMIVSADNGTVPDSGIIYQYQER